MSAQLTVLLCWRGRAVRRELVDVGDHVGQTLDGIKIMQSNEGNESDALASLCFCMLDVVLVGVYLDQTQLNFGLLYDPNPFLCLLQ